VTQSVNNRYLGALAEPSKAPVYIIEFDGIPDRFSNLTVQNPTGTKPKKLAGGVDGSGSQITVDEGRSSIGQMSFDLQDSAEDITKLMSLYDLPNRKVTITTGFANIDEKYYVEVFVGKVLDFKLKSDNTTWSFQAVNNLSLEREKIFTAVTKLTAGVGSGDATIPVVGTSTFATATAGKFYIKINDEVISYTGVTATSFTGCTRGELGTIAAAHSLDDQAFNHLHLLEHGIDLILQILTSTGLGTNGPYDVFPASAGLGIDQTLVDVAHFISEKQKWLNIYNFEFDENEPTEGKAFLESQLYRFMNAYPIISNEGKISIKVYTPPLPTQTIAQLTDNNLLGAPAWQGNIMARYFFNEIDFDFDYDFRDQEFKTKILYADSTSQARFNETRTMDIQSRGLKTDIGGTTRIPDKIADRVFKRFGIPSPVISAKSFFADRLIEPGDVIRLTSDKIPDIDRGVRGVENQLVEAVRVRPDYRQGKNDFMLLNTGISAGRKYAAITPTTDPPTSFPVFSAATSAQKNYAFISREINPTTGVMGDSTDGYYITP